jgi:hypothetical protein
MSGRDSSEMGRLYEWASLTGDRLPEEYEPGTPGSDPN